MSNANCCNVASDRWVYRPTVRVVESVDAVELIAAVPGADENSTEITVEHDTLTLKARMATAQPEGQHVLYNEFRDGDYLRSFKLSDEIDRGRIEARVKDGVLRVRMPKVEQVQPKKIAVLAG